jgi:hypothetical protein
MQRHSGLALGTYLVGAALIVLPLFDASISTWPFRFGDVRWRFGASGLFANALMIPNAGLLLILAAAITYGHNRFRRVIGVVAVAGAALWLVAIVMFGLDAIQARPLARPEMRTSFAVASWSAVGKMLLSAVTLFVLGLIGIRTGQVAIHESRDPEPLIVSASHRKPG